MIRIDRVPWVWRSWARHELLPVPADINDSRDGLVQGQLNLEGLIEDLDHSITTLTAVRDRLAKYVQVE